MFHRTPILKYRLLRTEKMEQGAVFHLATSVQADGSDDPSVPFMYNVGAEICEKFDSDKCEATSVRVAIMGCCPYRAYICHGDVDKYAHIWMGSKVEGDPNILAHVDSKWIGQQDHYALIECNKCQLRLDREHGSLSIIVAWGGMAGVTATKIDVSGTVLKSWRPVAIKAAGKSVLNYEGGIELGRSFPIGRPQKSAKAPASAKSNKKKIVHKKSSKVVRRVKASGKKVLKNKKNSSKSKKVVKRTSMKKDWRSAL